MHDQKIRNTSIQMENFSKQDFIHEYQIIQFFILILGFHVESPSIFETCLCWMKAQKHHLSHFFISMHISFWEFQIIIREYSKNCGLCTISIYMSLYRRIHSNLLSKNEIRSSQSFYVWKPIRAKVIEIYYPYFVHNQVRLRCQNMGHS